jgi:CSLREA domain-containing protein
MIPQRFFFITLALFALTALTLMRTSAAPLSTIVVNSNLDGALANDGNCALREAIINANNDDTSGSTDCAAGVGADNIVFNNPPGGPQTMNVKNVPTHGLPFITQKAWDKGSPLHFTHTRAVSM